MKLAALQLNSQSNVSANLNEILSQMARVVEMHGPDVIALPEYALCLTSNEEKARAGAQVVGQSTPLEQLAEFARQNTVHVHVGSIVERDQGGRHYNTSVVLDPSGEIISTYRKRNLFQTDLEEWSHSILHNEERFLSSGETFETFTALGATFGNSICYDLRFPLHYQSLKARGAEIVFAPSAFTELTGRRDWERLIRMRATENGCYVVAANQCRSFDDGQYSSWGHSMIVSPTGEILAECDREPGFIVAKIDLEPANPTEDASPPQKHCNPGGERSC